MGGNSIEEPAVVADNHRATTKRLNALFKGAQGGNIQVVGRLVQQKHIAAAPQQLGQMDAVAFAAGKFAHFLLLVRAAKIKPRAIRTTVHGLAAQIQRLLPARDFLINRAR